MSLDLLTLSITLTSTAVLSALVLFIIWRIDRNLDGLLQWAVGSLLIGLAFLAIFAVRLVDAGGNLDAFISNSLSMPAVLLVAEGSLRFRGIGSPERLRRWIVVVPLLVLVAWWLRDEPRLRFLFHDAVAVLGLGGAGAVLLWGRVDNEERRAYLLAAGSAFLLALAFAGRWLVAALGPDEAVGPDMPVSLALYFVLILFSIGWSYGVAVACYYRSRQHVLQLARVDALTGLPNRRSIDEELGRFVRDAQRSGREFAVYLIDIDGFKIVNDQYGHSEGDRLLREFSDRLQYFVRETDLVGRLGGDEFLLIARDLSGPDAMNIIRKRLVMALEGPMNLPGGEHFPIRVSCGVARWSVDGETADALLTTADRRMYRDKSQRQSGGVGAPAV